MTSSLFGRTFLLIAGLLVTSLLGAWLVMNQRLGPTPEQSVAWEVASLANVTKVSLETADPESRKELLSLLDRREGLRLVPRSNSDRIVAFDRSDTERNLTRPSKPQMRDRTQLTRPLHGLEAPRATR